MRGLLVFDFAFIGTVLTVLALGPDSALIDRAHYLLLLSVVASGTLPLAARIEQLRRRNFLLNLHTQFSASELRDANRKLRDLSERDPLTGALNRRGLARIFDERLTSASASAQAGTNGVRAAMIMVDIDHFKHFNDTHGHLAGDTCLTMVAQALHSVIGEERYVVARYGGEEFIVALCESYSGHASDLAEDIRKRIAALLVPVGGEHGPSGRSLVTASLGVGLGANLIVPVAYGDCEFIREELIEMADAALYSAKNSGRNRVELVGRADPIAHSA
nr:GGDEF domain-containing protein [Erythrobacter sp. F6033]